MKSEQALHKRASASVASAKKSLTELIGDRAAGLFGPIEAILQSAANEIQDSEPFDRAERARELTDQANEALAKLMEQRNPKPVVATDEEILSIGGEAGDEDPTALIPALPAEPDEKEENDQPEDTEDKPVATTPEIPVGETAS
jgi:hypothetical protein